MALKALVFLAFFWISPPLEAAPMDADEAQPQYVMCRMHKTVRTIRVEAREDGSCKTKYTKAGIDRVVGTGQFKSSCFQFLDNIKANLEAASWRCRDISSTEITTDFASN